MNTRCNDLLSSDSQGCRKDTFRSIFGPFQKDIKGLLLKLQPQMFADVNLTKYYLKCLSEVKVQKETFWYMTSRKQIDEVVDAITLILQRSRSGTVWFYTSTSNKRAVRPKLYTKSLTRDLKRMYSRLTLVRISVKLQTPCVLYIGTGVSLLSRERFLYI